MRDSLNDALALLDDVNENLETFDTKLQFMREDIGAIEVCSFEHNQTPYHIKWQKIFI